MSYGSQLVFCLPASMSQTCRYFPATEHQRSFVGTHCAYTQRDGQAELTWVVVTYQDS